MCSTAVENLVVRHSAARFAGTQGYRLEGDQAHLNAAVTVDAAAESDPDWALQLWACEPGGLRGIKVAELPVGNLATSGGSSLEGWTVALPPAGQAACTMVLALASGDAGRFDHIHDLAVFPALASFCQPCLEGTVAYRFDASAVDLSVGAVANPRDADNLSGSLSLELWALPRPYEGGAFEGFRIAAAELGCLAGQARLDDVRLSLPASPLPAGTWQIVLMLREWTAAGFVTRDYANFAVPYLVEEAATEPAAVSEQAAPVVAAPPVQLATPTPAEPGRVSVNHASAAELAALKGLSKNVAAAIVAARPYARLDDVLRAKGMGPKLLEKLRDRLSH